MAGETIHESRAVIDEDVPPHDSVDHDVLEDSRDIQASWYFEGGRHRLKYRGKPRGATRGRTGCQAGLESEGVDGGVRFAWSHGRPGRPRVTPHVFGKVYSGLPSCSHKKAAMVFLWQINHILHL